MKRHDTRPHGTGCAARKAGIPHHNHRFDDKACSSSKRRPHQQPGNSMRNHGQVHPRNRQQMRDARKPHSLHQLLLHVSAIANQHRLIQRRALTKQFTNLLRQKHFCLTARFMQRKPAIPLRCPARKNISREIVPLADRLNPPIHAAWIAHRLLFKQPARSCNALANTCFAHFKRFPVLILHNHQGDEYRPLQRCFAIHHDVAEHHPKILCLSRNHAFYVYAGLCRAVINAQFSHRSAITGNQHEPQQKEQRAAARMQANHACTHAEHADDIEDGYRN